MARYFLQFGHRAVAVAHGTMEIGRSERCELRIDDPRVSRHHAILYLDSVGLRVRDNGSHNGVFVNGRRITGTTVLAAGDRVTIGPEHLEVREGEPTGSPTEQLTRPLLPDGAGDDVVRLTSLSQRERQVFELLARGHAHREIGERLGLSTKTVETYRARIGDKLSVRTRAELIALALRSGVLVSEDDDHV